MSYWNYYPPKPSVAQRKKEAEALIAKLAKKGGCSPVVLQGQKISNSYWGKAWCKHVEGWHDFYNRLERGRSYVRAHAVVDLRLEPGKIIAKVNGSSLYNVRITVTALPDKRWKAFKAASFGQVGSLLDLLQGKLPEPVLQLLTSPQDGLFPRTAEMKLDCDCPDGANMCKHVAAVLYGVGNRLDTQPELLFGLRGVDHTELVAHAATAAADLGSRAQDGNTLRDEDLAGIFGIELVPMQVEQVAVLETKAPRNKKEKKKASAPSRSRTGPKGNAKRTAISPLRIKMAKLPIGKKAVAKKSVAKDPGSKGHAGKTVRAATKGIAVRPGKKSDQPTMERTKAPRAKSSTAAKGTVAKAATKQKLRKITAKAKRSK